MASKIMLIEDDASMSSLLGMLLELEGYMVAHAPDFNGEAEIVEAVRKEAPDVILMDVHLKQYNGIEVLRKMRADPQLKDVRVIMSSGMDMQDQCMSVGANGFLLKPYMPDDLIRKLKG